METYTRKLSVREVKILGDNWQERLDLVIANMITSNTAPDTAGARVLTIMSSGAPVNVRALLTSYDVLYGVGVISIDYLRLVIRTLWVSGKIRKVSRGVYEKVV